ncbi:uncharacterized protein L201_005850 [Kwoniella dendrophila CBS 6074]|uniref:Methyltransferase type 11 domain-containing protein n=1 Tax=Kwoniella dendrophila CBS 6074 TaxID=1295534 RepID=A0AAX4K1Y4_9TREE
MSKWNPQEWLEASSLEYYLGTEEVTKPAGLKLLEQSGIISIQPKLSSHSGLIPSSSSTPSVTSDKGHDGEIIKVFDEGAGLGQVTSQLIEHLLKISNKPLDRYQILLGDHDDSLLSELEKRQQTFEGWSNVTEIEKLDGVALHKPDNTFDYLFGNFLYFLLSDPIKGLEESIRVLKPNGVLGFSTWAYSGPFHLLQHAIALLPNYPFNPNPPPPGGNWMHPQWLKQTLESKGMKDIKIEPYEFTQTAESAAEMSRKMHHVVKIVTSKWGSEQRELGWKVFEKIEDLLIREQGKGPVKITSVALIVTARKP